jgi:hypothetical protein
MTVGTSVTDVDQFPVPLNLRARASEQDGYMGIGLPWPGWTPSASRLTPTVLPTANVFTSRPDPGLVTF